MFIIIFFIISIIANFLYCFIENKYYNEIKNINNNFNFQRDKILKKYLREKINKHNEYATKHQIKLDAIKKMHDYNVKPIKNRLTVLKLSIAQNNILPESQKNIENVNKILQQLKHDDEFTADHQLSNKN